MNIIDNDNSINLGKVFNTNKVLRHLKLNRCNLYDNENNDLMHSIKHITKLDLSNNKLKNSSAVTLHQNLLVNQTIK